MDSQEPITPNQHSKKGDLLSEAPVGYSDCGGCNALPKRKPVLSPAMGETCGRRERRTDGGTRGGAILSRAQVATVEGTQIRYEVVSLRGWTIQSGSRSVRACAEGSFLGIRSHRRQRVSSGCKRRGTSSACAKRPHSSRESPNKHFRVSRTRPSLNPETRATSVMGSPMQQSRYRGRASSRK